MRNHTNPRPPRFASIFLNRSSFFRCNRQSAHTLPPLQVQAPTSLITQRVAMKKHKRMAMNPYTVLWQRVNHCDKNLATNAYEKMGFKVSLASCVMGVTQKDCVWATKFGSEQKFPPISTRSVPLK
jgi:hypothetical protein